MPSNKELFQRISQLDNFSGGAVFGKAVGDEAKIAYTANGEFVHEVSDEGELSVEFPSGGLGLIYDKEGFLDLVSIDFEGYLNSFSQSDRDKMPNQGEDILEIERRLKDTETTVVMDIKIKESLMSFVITDSFGEEVKPVDPEAFNFYESSNSLVTVAGIDLFLYVERSEDEFVIGLGEVAKTEGDTVRVHLLVVSNQVNFMKEVKSGTPRDLQNLARKILLN